MKKNIAICLLFFAGFWIVFLSMQNKTVYFNTLGKISKNYFFMDDGNRGKEKKTFEKITDENMLNWDGEHFFAIKEKGYSADHEYRFAFFPLFSFIWKFSTLPPSKVIFLNFFMFTLGLLLLAYLFKQKWQNILLVLSLPMCAVFLIPYSEATLFLMFSIAIWGFMKDKYWIYFIGMALASLSRNILPLIIPAILCAELLFFVKERKIKQSLLRLCMGILPVIIGTALVSLIQYHYGSDSIFKFLEALKHWNRSFSFPNIMHLNDWSQESFGINIPALIILGIPLIIYLMNIALKQFGILKKIIHSSPYSAENKYNYMNLVLMFCCLAIFCSVFFFQKGCLNGLSRYILCSPYFVILMFLNHEKILSVSPIKRGSYFVSLIILSVVLFASLSYTSSLSFHYLGFLIFVGVMALYLFQDMFKKSVYNLLLAGIFLLNILWTSYLFNMFLCNGWLYTFLFAF